MPKNKGKGGKNRRRGKNENESAKRELVYKDEGQEYGLVKNVLGGNRLLVQCMDGQPRICNIRGKMRKKVWIGVTDYVLVSLREFEPNIGDIIYKYNNDEVRSLRNEKEISELAPANATDDIMFTTETTQDLDIENDTLPDVLAGYHNPNRPIKAPSGSDDDSDEDDDTESDDESSSEDELQETRKKMASLGIDELICGGPQKIDYSVNTNRKPTNTLLEMSRGNDSNQSSDDEDQRKVQENAEMLQQLSDFRKNVGYDRINKSSKKR